MTIIRASWALAWYVISGQWAVGRRHQTDAGQLGGAGY